MMFFSKILVTFLALGMSPHHFLVDSSMKEPSSVTSFEKGRTLVIVKVSSDHPASEYRDSIFPYLKEMIEKRFKVSAKITVDETVEKYFSVSCKDKELQEKVEKLLWDLVEWDYQPPTDY